MTDMYTDSADRRNPWKSLRLQGKWDTFKQPKIVQCK